jgi:hypothetical protein
MVIDERTVQRGGRLTLPANPPALIITVQQTAD